MIEDNAPVEKAIKDVYRDLIETEPAGTITVARICELAHVSRKTFYQHFSSKDDLIEALVHDDLIVPIVALAPLLPDMDEQSGVTLVFDRLCRSVIEHRNLYEALVVHGGAHRVVKIMQKEFIVLIERLLSAAAGDNGDTEVLERPNSRVGAVTRRQLSESSIGRADESPSGQGPEGSSGQEYGGPSDQVRYATRYQAGGLATCLVQWIRDGFTVETTEMVRWLTAWTPRVSPASAMSR